MSQGDPGQSLLPSLPRDDEGPVFAEPWEAQAFAMAVRLSELGHFTWTDWAAELASQIESADDGGDTSYYEHWLATLEVMVTSSGLSTASELGERRERWRRAAESTPHGHPIEI